MSGLTTFVGFAHPWMCDAMGHVNARHYMAMFDDASLLLLDQVAAGPISNEAGWADVRCEIDYVTEIRAGTALQITSLVERVGTSSLTMRHLLAGSSDGVAHARAKVVSVRFDLAARRAMPLLPDERRRAEELLGGKAGTSPTGTSQGGE
ncbi:MAG TPA: acyl-CoA thioesterase [Devosiaceae bacterium]|jgi:acyl-CoA thioester hydrolase|nr:acyl-CoA thioesterase [Devosiaceae bacterium]